MDKKSRQQQQQEPSFRDGIRGNLFRLRGQASWDIYTGKTSVDETGQGLEGPRAISVGEQAKGAARDEEWMWGGEHDGGRAARNVPTC